MKKLLCVLLSLMLAIFLFQGLFAQTAGFNAVGFEDITAKPMTSVRINGSNNAANQIPAGTILVYKTSEGRYGKFQVRAYGYNLGIDFVTYNKDGSVFKKGENLVIRGTWHADLDLGAEVKMGNTADFWWEQVNKTERYLVPMNNTQMAVYKFPDYMAMLTNAPKVAKAGQELGAKMLVQVRELTPGVPSKQIAVDLVLVSKPVYPAPAPFAVYTPNYKEGVLLKGGREFVYAPYGTTAVKLNGTNKIPDDTPAGNYYLAAVADAGNKVFEANERNNVAYWPIRIEAADLFSALGVDEIKAMNLSGAKINGSNNSANRLAAGTIVVYKTNGGRYGKFLVKNYGYNLVVDWATYNADGTVFAKGANMTIRGTYLYDLDKGMEINEVVSDFWWEQVNSVERYLTPKNGAVFAIYPRFTVVM